MVKSISMILAVLAGILLSGSHTFAQTTSISANERASAGGNTGNELRNIYRQGVGQGYTSESLNAISLRSAQARVGNYGQSSAVAPRSSTAGSVPSLSAGSSSKPFSSVTSSPTVSPYLNLFRDDFDGSGDFNYQTLVRPQLQQQQVNQQFQRQNLELSARIQQISAQSDYQNPAGSESIYPTGHQTGFGAYSHFYPSLGQPRRKQ